MPDDSRLAALLAEYATLDPQRDAARLCALLAEAAPLVDRAAQPKRWGGMRFLYARLAAGTDAAGSLAAYQDVLTVFGPDETEAWTEAHYAIGVAMLPRAQTDPDAFDAALGHLEAALPGYPGLTLQLAEMYRYRPHGDPFENWGARVRYLGMTAAQVDRRGEPARWASIENRLGVACGEQPGPPDADAMERRIACHREAMAELTDTASDIWIDTSLQLSEALEMRVQGDAAQSNREAESLARGALAACGDGHPDLARRALLALARMLASPAAASVADLEEALPLFDRAEALIDPAADPAGRANVAALRASACLALIERGQHERVDDLDAQCTAALAGYDPLLHAGERRMLLQVQGEGRMAGERFAPALASFAQAIALGEAALAQATSTPGRLERIFQLADSAARAAWCALMLGRATEALEWLDRGKSRLWTGERVAPIAARLRDLVPEQGALLFPLFVRAGGAVIVVGRDATGIAVTSCRLPALDGAAVLELQRGTATDALGGWLRAYVFRRSDPAGFHAALDTVGATLYAKLWTPLLATLREAGIAPGAELVWFPQGGIGALPVHAAWRDVDGERRPVAADYAIRHAPAAHVLVALTDAAPIALQDRVIVCNPTGDLPQAALECAWVARTWNAGATRLLSGEQATQQDVVAALAHASHVLMSTHAQFDFASPLDSRVMLAGGATLTLEAWRSLLSTHPLAHVALSACETAVAQVTTTADEFLGMPTALLASGVRSVLGTLWPVEDDASAYLVGRFYAEWAKPQTSAAAALARAQTWLRTLTARTLSDALRELKADPGALGAMAAERRSALAAEDPDRRLFDHPYFWAGYVICGIDPAGSAPTSNGSMR